MGLIIDQNADENAQDTWALVTGTAVVNTIVANLGFIETIQSSYDYLVDLTVGEQAGVSTGYIYDPETDTFTAPPIDWVSIIRSDLNSIHSYILQSLSDAGQTSSEDVVTACSYAVSDSSPTFATNESDLFDAICTFIQAVERA